MGGTFKIMFVNPKYDPTDKNSPQTVLTRSVKDNDSENTIRYMIRDYYGSWKTWGSDVEVKKH